MNKGGKKGEISCVNFSSELKLKRGEFNSRPKILRKEVKRYL
jgi:hypothetical protein